MKLEIIKNMKNFGQVTLTCLVLWSMMFSMLVLPFAQTTLAASDAKAQAQTDDPLTEETLQALVEKLKEALAEVIEDEDTQNSIIEKWDARLEKLVGKTAKQAIDLLLADVKSVVEDAEVVNQLKESFTAAISTEEPTEEPAEPTEKPATEPTETKPTQPAQPPVRPGSNVPLRQYIRSLNYDPRVLLAVQHDGGTLIYEKVKDQNTERRQGDGKIIRCLRTTRSLSKNFDDIAILQPTQGVIYPGALVFADQEMVDGKPRPLTGLPRAPINLRLDLPGLQEEGSFTINDPTDGKVQTAVNKALNHWNNSTSFKDGYVNPSRSSYNSTIAYSSEQLAMSLGFNAKWASGEASAQFKYSSSSEKNVVAVVFKQVFYTVTLDAPNLAEGFFDGTVNPEEAKDVFNEKTPPAYVSSVNYGRIIMLRMETDKSTTAVDAEAAFKYGTGAISVGADVKLKYDKILANSAITVVTMGGNAEVASESVSAKSAADLMPIIKGKNAVYSKNNPGVPIGYTVKFLKDNSIAKMGTTTDYTTNDCQELPNLWVKVVHSGAYIAHFTVTWDEPGKPGQTRKEHGKTAGYQIKFDFPGDATNIRLKMENDTGLVWQPQREILNRVLQPADLNCVYTVTGTTLGSGSDKNQCEMQKPN
jgi:thiol-activated cytolysin